MDRVDKIYMILSLRERLKASGALAYGSNLATDPHGHTQTFKLFFNRSRLLMLRRTKPIEEKQQSLRDNISIFYSGHGLINYFNAFKI